MVFGRCPLWVHGRLCSFRLRCWRSIWNLSGNSQKSTCFPQTHERSCLKFSHFSIVEQESWYKTGRIIFRLEKASILPWIWLASIDKQKVETVLRIAKRKADKLWEVEIKLKAIEISIEASKASSFEKRYERELGLMFLITFHTLYLSLYHLKF